LDPPIIAAAAADPSSRLHFLHPSICWRFVQVIGKLADDERMGRSLKLKEGTLDGLSFM
jgi:hypothetical protein